MKDRHLELSAKIMEMGRALIKEGRESNDIIIAQTGTNMVTVGTLMLNEPNLMLFGELCGLLASKIILDNMEKNNHEYMEFLRQKTSNESYEDFIKRINKLRDDNGHPPIE